MFKKNITKYFYVAKQIMVKLMFCGTTKMIDTEYQGTTSRIFLHCAELVIHHILLEKMKKQHVQQLH